MARRQTRSSAGYSGTPLVDKLGIKAGMRVIVLSGPPAFAETLGRLPVRASLANRLAPRAAMIIAFATSLANLQSRFGSWKRALASDGALWVCWPKRASGVATDITENAVREVGLTNGLVDVKVCAVDTTWSGLRFVYRLKDRR